MPDIQIPIPSADTTETPPETPAPEALDGPETPDQPETGQQDTPEPDTFPRDYVERLRRESAGYRERAGRSDELGTRLLTATVAAHGGALADPGDLLHFGSPADLMGEDGYPDPERITAAAEALVTARPHLATRRVSGDAGQGARGSVPKAAPDLAAILRGAAG